MPEVSWLGVVVAALASFAIGSVWYSPVMFTKIWQREARVADNAKGRNMAMIFAVAFVLQLLAAFVLAMFLGVRPGLAYGAGVGFHVGLFLVAGALGRQLRRIGKRNALSRSAGRYVRIARGQSTG